MIWLALAHDMHADAKLRKAKARAIWPWVLCRLKDDGGFASDNSLDPWRASDDHDGIFTEDQAAAMLAALRDVGLLARTDDGRWTTPNWSNYQADPTASDRKRAQRARESAQKATKKHVTVVTRDMRDVTVVTPVTPTGQDRTGQNNAADAAATRTPAPAREPPVQQQVITSTTDLQPHPTAIKVPKALPKGDTSIAERAAAIVGDHPEGDSLRPLAEIAIEVTGIDVSVFTLEQWSLGGYSSDRIRAGCAFSIQEHAGRVVPEGRVITTASRWMQRARPDEYAHTRPVLSVVPMPPPSPPRVPTEEEKAKLAEAYADIGRMLSDTPVAARR